MGVFISEIKQGIVHQNVLNNEPIQTKFIFVPQAYVDRTQLGQRVVRFLNYVIDVCSIVVNNEHIATQKSNLNLFFSSNLFLARQ